jgi:hypothetical protein
MTAGAALVMVLAGELAAGFVLAMFSLAAAIEAWPGATGKRHARVLGLFRALVAMLVVTAGILLALS